MVHSTIANVKVLLSSVIQSLLVIFAIFSDWKSAVGTPSENKEHDDSAIDLTTGCKAAQTVSNLPQDLSLPDVEPPLEPDDDLDNHDDNPPTHDFTGPGTCTHHLYNYKHRVETLSNQLINVANVTVQMEENGAACEENIKFASIVDECGKELITKGNMLLHLSTNTKKIHDDFSNKILLLPKKKKHKYTVVTWQPPELTVDVVVDSDLIITQRNADDDRNMYHDPGKYPPMTIKHEFPDCSLAEVEEEGEQNSDSNDLLRMSAAPIQSRKKQAGQRTACMPHLWQGLCKQI